jgi:hypothetical protein
MLQKYFSISIDTNNIKTELLIDFLWTRRSRSNRYRFAMLVYPRRLTTLTETLTNFACCVFFNYSIFTLFYADVSSYYEFDRDKQNEKLLFRRRTSSLLYEFSIVRVNI